jgi:taurine dioxygenase
METAVATPADAVQSVQATFDAKPLSWRIGSEIKGLDLRRSDNIPEATIQALWRLLGERGILLFRRQGLTHEQHLAFTRRFGPLAETGMTSRYAPPGYPDLFTVTNIKSNGARSETENAAQQWHTDQSFLPVPARASVLRCELAPENGGDTMFSNVAAVYDSLSEGLKATLESLQAFHTLLNTRCLVMTNRKPMNDTEVVKVEGAMHPVVLVHPDTGRKCLYISDQMLDHFDGWTVAESKPLLDYLCKQIEHPAYTYRHRWQAGDAIMWDNRCTQHYAPLDYDFAAMDRPENRRLMFRSTLA